MTTVKSPFALALTVFLLALAGAFAQSQPTNTLVICGLVKDLKGYPVDGVVITVLNTGTSIGGISRTPYPQHPSGTYFIALIDTSNIAAAKANDVIAISIQDPFNRLKRTPKVRPSTIKLTSGDTTACLKRINLTMF